MSFQKLKIYEEGLEVALQDNPLQSDLSLLPDSQASTVHHKSAIDTYNLGYKLKKDHSPVFY